jgi:copper chaperone CopZ
VLLHALEGRLRLKIRELKGAPDEALVVEDRLRGINGVHHVTANPLTGSVLIQYDSGSTGVDEITGALRAWGYLREAIPTASPEGTAGGGLGRLVLRATTEAALQQLLVALI